MTRWDLHQRFVQRFAKAESLRHVSPEKLAEIEISLGVEFPRAYAEFYTRYGPIEFRDVLHLLVAREIQLWDIRSLLSETELLDVSRIYANAGMRASLVGFASDSMGNLFCFDRANLATRGADAPVWFFDHEFCSDSQLTDSFDAWLSSYVALPPFSEPA